MDAAGRRVDLDPLDEAAHRRLMALLARTGDRAAAIRQYRACVATLERELGVAPLAETTELYEAIRDGRFPLTRVAGARCRRPRPSAPPGASALRRPPDGRARRRAGVGPRGAPRAGDRTGASSC